MASDRALTISARFGKQASFSAFANRASFFPLRPGFLQCPWIIPPFRIGTAELSFFWGFLPPPRRRLG
jgi:hypothetical protein